MIFHLFSYASGVMAVAITQTGEPGYSLYVPTGLGFFLLSFLNPYIFINCLFTFLLIFLSTESALHLYDKLMRIGVNYGIRNVGQLVYR